MRTTTRTLAGVAMGAVVVLVGCGTGSADPPGAVVSSTTTVVTTARPTTAASITATTTAPAGTAAPTTTVLTMDTSRLDRLLRTVDGQIERGSKALDDATAAIASDEGDVNP